MEELVYEVPVWWVPSRMAILKGYAIAEKEAACPSCGSRSLRFIRRTVLEAQRLKWPHRVGGDEQVYSCDRCGRNVVVKLIYREPEPSEDVFSEFCQIYEAFLDSCSRGGAPNYITFSIRAANLLIDLKEHDEEAYAKALERVGKDLNTLRSEMGSDPKTHSVYRLMEYFVSKLPPEEFEQVSKQLEKSYVESLVELRNREGVPPSLQELVEYLTLLQQV